MNLATGRREDQIIGHKIAGSSRYFLRELDLFRFERLMKPNHPTHFLFPRHPLEPQRVDDLFTGQWDAIPHAGFSASLMSDEVLVGDRPLKGIPQGCQFVYRGWMLTDEAYEIRSRAIE